jgi:protein-export membrane protein SecD
MAAQKKKYTWSILLIVVIVGGIWGGIVAAGLTPRLGLDLQGGVSVVLSPKERAEAGSLDKAVDIIRQRVDALGVAEPDVSRQGDNILVEIPGIKDQRAALNLIGRTAELRFRPVVAVIAAGTEEWAKTVPPVCGKEAAAGPADPAKEVVLCARGTDPVTGKDLPSDRWNKLRLGSAALVGRDVSGATAQPPQGSLQGGLSWQVDLNLTGDGAKKFADVTGKLACKPNGSPDRQLAIELDSVVESHPQMGEQVQCNVGITGGSAQITGSFGEKEAKDLALVLRYGALPVALEAQETNQVSPTLGHDSLRGGLIAGAIGLGLVLLYVVAFYRILGLVIWVGLVVFAAFVLGVIIVLGETAGFSLTLAGIAGLIVSVGIATDSYIVYFERIKDEVHQGKTIRASVDRAWSSAWRTIVAADLVTALAALSLYLLAVGGVRGFALTLGLATGLDLFISYLLMHPSVWLLAQTRFFNEAKRLGIRRVVGDATPAPVTGGER